MMIIMVIVLIQHRRDDDDVEEVAIWLFNFLSTKEEQEHNDY